MVHSSTRVEAEDVDEAESGWLSRDGSSIAWLVRPQVRSICHRIHTLALLIQGPVTQEGDLCVGVGVEEHIVAALSISGV